MEITNEKYNEILKRLVDNGLYYCNKCDTYFIVRNTADGDINTSTCPCCGVYSDDAVEDVEVID